MILQMAGVISSTVILSWYIEGWIHSQRYIKGKNILTIKTKNRYICRVLSSLILLSIEKNPRL